MILSSGVRLLLAICLAVAVHSPAAEQSKPATVRPGTAKMAALLEATVSKIDPMENPFMSDERASFIRSRLPLITNRFEEVVARGSLGRELLNAGEPAEALLEFKRAAQLLDGIPGLPSHLRAGLERHNAICHLRRGELDNCVAFHGPESCLLPLSAAAVHKDQNGSRAAITELESVLARAPQTLSARWLLNIAYMTVGEYPGKVPSQWLIPPKAFASNYPLPRFPNIADKLGLDQEGLAGGTVADDFDNDGDIDLMISSWGKRDQLRFYVNNGNGTFTERTDEAGLRGLVGGLNMVQADYNNDGFVDVFVLRGAWSGNTGRIPDSLIRNHGDGTFEDVTHEAGMVSFHPSQTATWFDFDGNGWLDLFIGNETTSDSTNVCELYRNNANGTFTECAAQAGVAVTEFVKGVTSGDYDNDGRPDLYLSLRVGTNILFRNEGPAVKGDSPSWRFRNVTASARVEGPYASFPTWFFDYDNDGWLDLFVSGYHIKDVGDVAADYLGLPHQGERARLYRNNHDGTFADVTKSAGLFKVLHTMGSNFGDLDNDGYLDFYLGTGDPDLSTIVPNRMFRNDRGTNFQDVTTAGGFGHLQKGHGVSFADFDNDGDQDIYESIGGAYSGDTFRNVLFENPGTSNRWIGFKLEGVKSNRSAIGARIGCTVKTEGRIRHIYKTVNSGGSFGCNPLRQHIGLGDASSVDLKVFWPTTSKTQNFTNLVAGRWYHIREDATRPIQLATKAFAFGSPDVVEE